VSASLQGQQSVELALVGEPYGGQGSFRPSNLPSNMDPLIHNSCRLPILNLPEGHQVLMGNSCKESYGNVERG